MKLRFLPGSRLGKWSFWLIIFAILFLLLFFVMIEVFDQRGGDGFFDNLYLTVPMLLAYASCVAAFITGLIAVIHSKERAILVFLTSILGLLITVYGAMVVLLP